MKKILPLIGYCVIGIIFFVWIVFLFVETKKEKIQDKDYINENIQTQEVDNDINEYLDENSDEIIDEDVISDADIDDYAEFLSQDNILTTEEIQNISDIKEKIFLLEQSYSQKKSFEIAKILIEAYQLNHQFDTAKKFYIGLPDSYKNKLGKKMDFILGFNSFSQTSNTEYKNLHLLLDGKYKNNVFSEKEYIYYSLIFDLIDKKYESAKKKLKKLENSSYKSFVDAIQNVFNQYTSMDDAPEYYQDALIAYQLMNFDFFAGAKKIVLPIINSHPDYVLPYQIVANIDFLVGKWESASHYFSQLLELDSQERNLYLYYLGVSYYNIKKYPDAILYLSQISDPSILLDSDRYLILSYIALGETDRVFSGWKRLLGYASIKKSDFYSFFEEALRRDYRLGKRSDYLQKNENLVQAYVTSCKKTLKGEDLQICDYGEMGVLAHQEKYPSGFESEVYQLVKKYPKSELFLLLGNIQLKKGDIKEATPYFMKALGLTKNEKEKKYLKNLILKYNKID